MGQLGWRAHAVGDLGGPRGGTACAMDERSATSADERSGDADDRPRPGGRRPALVRTPSAEPSSTQPSAGRRTAAGTRGEQRGADPHAGQRADEDRCPSGRSRRCRRRRCASAGGPQQDRGVEDVGADDAVRREAEDEDQARGRSARPEPTEVMPSTTPSTSADARRRRPCAARVERRRVSRSRGDRRRNSARPRTEQRDDEQRARDDRQQRRVEAVAVASCSRSSSHDAGDRRPGTLPKASHFETPRSTVPGAGGASRRRSW